MLPFHDGPVIHENIIAKILFASCSAKISYRENFRVYGSHGRSWIWCTKLCCIKRNIGECASFVRFTKMTECIWFEKTKRIADHIERVIGLGHRNEILNQKFSSIMNGLVIDTSTVSMYLTVYCCNTKVDEKIRKYRHYFLVLELDM